MHTKSQPFSEGKKQFTELPTFQKNNKAETIGHVRMRFKSGRFRRGSSHIGV